MKYISLGQPTLLILAIKFCISKKINTNFIFLSLLFNLMKKKIIIFQYIKKTIIYKFIKLIYYKIHNLKFIKKYQTITGAYYLQIFAFKDVIRNKIS